MTEHGGPYLRISLDEETRTFRIVHQDESLLEEDLGSFGSFNFISADFPAIEHQIGRWTFFLRGRIEALDNNTVRIPVECSIDDFLGAIREFNGMIFSDSPNEHASTCTPTLPVVEEPEDLGLTTTHRECCSSVHGEEHESYCPSTSTWGRPQPRPEPSYKTRMDVVSIVAEENKEEYIHRLEASIEDSKRRIDEARRESRHRG